jgi:hypothetical protein
MERGRNRESYHSRREVGGVGAGRGMLSTFLRLFFAVMNRYGVIIITYGASSRTLKKQLDRTYMYRILIFGGDGRESDSKMVSRQVDTGEDGTIPGARADGFCRHGCEVGLQRERGVKDVGLGL